MTDLCLQCFKQIRYAYTYRFVVTLNVLGLIIQGQHGKREESPVVQKVNVGYTFLA